MRAGQWVAVGLCCCLFSFAGQAASPSMAPLMLGAKKSPADKARDKAEKKLSAFKKKYDPAKKKLRKPAELQKDIAALDEAIEALAKLDAEAASELKGLRDEAVQGAEEGAASAETDRWRKGVGAPPKVAAAPGVEPIAPMAPTWCEGVLESYGKGLANKRPSLPKWQQGLSDPSHPILFSCVDPDWAVRQQHVAAYRQEISNRLGLTAQLNERLMKLGAQLEILDDQVKAQKDALCTSMLPSLEEGTASQRTSRELERIAVGCSAQLGIRLLDVDTPGGLSSQLAMAGFVSKLLRGLADDAEDGARLRFASRVAVANVVPLDPSALEKELQALNEYGQARALIGYYSSQRELEKFVRAFRTMDKKVKGLSKLVLEQPSAAAKAYLSKQANQDKALLELVLAMEAQRGSPMKGCAQKLWPYLKNALKDQRQPLEEVRIDGLLSWALAFCARNDPEVPSMEPIFTYFAERSTAVRGPYTAAYLAYVNAYNQAAPSRDNQAFEPSKQSASRKGPLSLPQPEANPLGEAELGASIFGHANAMSPRTGDASAVVKAVEKKGDTAVITFRTEKYMVDDYKCVETNKIDRVAPDGTVVYRTRCTKIGQHEASSTLDPLTVPAWAVAGVGPGSFLRTYWMSSNSKAPGRGWVMEAFESKAKKKRTSLLGVAQ